MLLIGSRALQVIAPNLLKRQPLDWDYIGTYDQIQAYLLTIAGPKRVDIEMKNGEAHKIICHTPKAIYEFEIAWSGSSGADLLAMDWWGSSGMDGIVVPDLDMLYALKSSHKYLRNSPHHRKTRSDILAMRAAGATIRPQYQEWYKKREAQTYTYAHPKLKGVAKEDFFKDDGIKYRFDHDDIHETQKHLDRPAYTYFKPEGSEVMCDRAMFEAAPMETRLFSVLEETQVLALERSQIPFPGVWSPRRSFEFSLNKVTSSITSGWWRAFAWENLDKVVSMYESDYVDRFWAAEKAGQVRPFNQEKRYEP